RGRLEYVRLAGALDLADFAAEPDGSFDVLDNAGTLRSFRADGSPRWAQKLADRTWAQLVRGPTVLQQPSEQWMPVAQDGAPLSRAGQTRGAHTAKHLANGHALLLDRVGEGELRLAELRGNASVQAWRITSETPLGEVQLAESHGNGLVVVMRAYTDERDEFVVLVLGSRGLVQRFSVASGSWTETAPLARFRLSRGRLYRLRTRRPVRSWTASTWRCRNESVPGDGRGRLCAVRCDGRTGVPPLLGQLHRRLPDVHDDDDARRGAGLRKRRPLRGLPVGRRLLELRRRRLLPQRSSPGDGHARRRRRLLRARVQDVARVDRHVARRSLLLACAAQRARTVRRSCVQRRERGAHPRRREGDRRRHGRVRERHAHR